MKRKSKSIKIMVISLILIALVSIGGLKYTNIKVENAMQSYLEKEYSSKDVDLKNVHFSLSFNNYIGLAHIDNSEEKYFTLVFNRKGEIVKDYYNDFFDRYGNYKLDESYEELKVNMIASSLLSNKVVDLDGIEIELTHDFLKEIGVAIVTDNSQLRVDEIKNLQSDEEYNEQFNLSSYMHLFFDKYWADIYQEYLEENEKKDSEFYAYYEDEFVNKEAANSPVDDFAESFVTFINEDKPTKLNVSDKKILFFYDFKEFVELRNHTLHNVL
ncbi:hypothetical protein SANA_13910 [Gottschalkiaceae bacterium SANA]|nr:hypothetical protein SANA_13910 [Gottschalkiaceae bacterium SANA]